MYNKDLNDKKKSTEYNDFLPLVVAGVPIAAGYGIYRIGRHVGYNNAEEEKCGTSSKDSSGIIIGLLVGVAATVGIVYSVKYFKKVKNG